MSMRLAAEFQHSRIAVAGINYINYPALRDAHMPRPTPRSPPRASVSNTVHPSPPPHTSTACCGDAARTSAARTPDGCSPPLSVA